jgi:rSAM/selenodomain-associated transferase 1
MRRMTVIVFAREPIPGQTKTRLISAIGNNNAAALADAFNRDTLAKAKKLAPAELVIAGRASGGAKRSRYFKTLAHEFGAWIIEQGAGHLGARMAAAMRPFTNAGGAMLMGTDTPSLPVKLLVKSADLFESNPLVIAPTLDGGYYLVAMRGKLPDIFKPMGWGGAEVLATTLKRLRDAGEPYCLGPWWYDIDRPIDLEFLMAHLKNRLSAFGGQAMALGSPHPCPATAAVLKRIQKESPNRFP